MHGGPPTYSASRSTYGISRIASLPMWWMTSLRSMQLGVLPTLVCAATRRSSSRPCWTVASRSASTRSARVITLDLSRTGNDVELHRAVDAAKDQSYVLGVLTRDQLRRSYFPLGSSRKADVRAEARDRGLAIAEKPDSHDICFIANGDTAGFLDKQLGRRPGNIVDLAGAKVGEHGGSHRFTVGQRRGLRLGTPADDHQPRFVIAITPTTNTITVGPRNALSVKIISAIRPAWTGERSGRKMVRPGAGSGTRTSHGRQRSGS